MCHQRSANVFLSMFIVSNNDYTVIVVGNLLIAFYTKRREILYYKSYLRFCFTVSPVIRVPNQLVGAPLSTDVVLECFVEASPKSINYWVKDNGKILFFDNF